jgi:DNA-binding CsgD family transcriptional regulator
VSGEGVIAALRRPLDSERRASLASLVTARNHVSHILEKLGMSRRSEAAAFAARLGLGGGPH